ncbi:MAG: oxidoreductase [Planctomycetota bacterium]
MSQRMQWTTKSIPPQDNKVMIVTGANAGLGRATARALAAAGAEVVMAVRSVEKGEAAADELRAGPPGAKLHVMPLDLSRLESVRAFADAFASSFGRLDGLINNAGIYDGGSSTTEEGFALQMGVNHLGHFALTGLLLPRLLATPGSRVATLSSGLYRRSTLALDSFHAVEVAHKNGYGRSKLANMLFATELQQRLERVNAETISIAVGPGPTKSEGAREGIGSLSNRLVRGAVDLLTNHIMSSPEDGAKPSVRAVTDPEAKGGDYFVPGGFLNMWGAPLATAPRLTVEQTSLSRGLWDRSAELTGVSYGALE